jgi:hypothetical protein
MITKFFSIIKHTEKGRERQKYFKEENLEKIVLIHFMMLKRISKDKLLKDTF